MPWANSVTLQLWITAGPRFEPQVTAGLAHYLEHLFFDGTKSYPSNRKLNRAVEAAGGDIDASTHKEYVVYQIKLPHQNQLRATEFLYELIFNPLLSKKDVEKERGIIKQELKREVDNIESYRWDFILKSLWPKNHPLSENTLGSEASIKTIQRADLLKYKRKMYNPGNMFLMVAGNFESKNILNSIKKTFGFLGADKHIPIFEKIEFQRHRQRPSRIFIEKREKAKQAYITLSFLTDLSPSHPKITALKVLDTMLQKRIFDFFVYQSGLSYSAFTNLWTFKDHALENIMVEVAPEKIKYSVDKIIEEVKNLDINPESITEAANSLKKSLFLNLADTDKFAEFIAEQEWYTGNIKSPEEMIQEINNVGVSQIKELKSQIFKYRNALLTIIGDATTSKKELEKTLKNLPE